MKPKHLLQNGLKMNRIIFFIAICLGISCASNPQTPQLIKYSGGAQGTYYAVSYYDSAGRNFQSQMDSLFGIFDRSFSLWTPNSIINKVNNNQDVTVDAWFTDVFEKSQMISRMTGGAFDITVGKLTAAYGFGSKEPKELTQEDINKILLHSGYQKISLQKGKVIKKYPDIQLDFNAIAKGYMVDVLGVFLETQGVHTYLIDVGGEIRVRGMKPNQQPWVIGVEKPTQTKEDERVPQIAIPLKDKSIATSGNYRKYYEKNGIRYAHTIDPITGRPAQHTLLSASIIADETWYADAIATAMMVMGLEKAKVFLLQHPEVEAYLIYSNPTTGVYEHWETSKFFK